MKCLRLPFHMMASVIALCFATTLAFADTYSDLVPDRSTPEKAIKILTDNVITLEQNFENLERIRTSSHTLSYPQPTEAERRRVERAKRTVLESLDLSSFPDWSRETAGVEAGLMLNELLRRVALAQPIEFVQLGNASWTIKGTYIQLVKLATGMRAGDVIVSAESISNLPRQYQDSVSDRPITGFDSYRYFTETPGGVFPPKWAGIVLYLPEFWKISLGSNTIWQWVLFSISLVAAILLPVLVYFISGHVATGTFAAASTGILMSWFGHEFAIREASFTGTAGILGASLFSIFYFTALAALAFLIIESLSNIFTRFAVKEDRGNAPGFTKLLFRILGVVAACSVALYGLSTAGIPVVGIVAGLGVGGLAVALAAKTTLENLLACIVLYIDKSIEVGDKIETKELSGIVEHIGMRSIRVRGGNGNVTTITNSKFADLTVTKNIDDRAPE